MNLEQIIDDLEKVLKQLEALVPGIKLSEDSVMGSVLTVGTPAEPLDDPEKRKALEDKVFGASETEKR